jgi:hypothetical protein
MNFENESGQFCSRFAAQSATLTRLESDRHVYQRRSYSAGKYEQE